jgi:hypothetical protein
MRTKALVFTALLSAASAFAQSNVYSVNVVGYTTITAPPGFSIIANQLDATNTVGALIPTPPDGTILYKYTTAFVGNSYFFGWSDPEMTLNPGEAAFFYNPLQTAYTMTFAGEVRQGNLTNDVPSGFSLLSSIVPQSGAVDADLGLPVGDGDIVYFYRGGQFVGYSYFFGWPDPANPPAPAVGEGFMLYRAGASTEWTRNFTVQ